MEVRVFLLCLALSLCEAKKLVVVLIDGVRWDYLDDPELKGLPRMVKEGVRAPKVVPVFPSLSYPNWGSLVTGLYPENQGFVDNYLYDNKTNLSFDMIPHPNSTNPIWWNEAEPIWITAEKNKLPAALYWWAGCEVEIMGEHPTICERQRFGPVTEEEKIDFLERIDDLVNLFKESKHFPTDRMSLAMMYYGPVDYAGHKYGPVSKETKAAMKDIDDILFQMQEKFQKAGLSDEVNIMVISDHGMTDVKSAKEIDLGPFGSSIKYQLSAGTVSSIIPIDGMLDKLYNDIVAAKIAGLQAYKKKDIPEEYHIKNNRRTTPLYLEAKKGYLINWLNGSTKLLLKESPYINLGHHGYNPAEVADMKTIFVATGPAFKKGFITEELYNIDMYNIMCSVLGILPLPNNGSWSRVQNMLVKQDDPMSPYTNSVAVHTSVSLNCWLLLIASIVIIINRL